MAESGNGGWSTGKILAVVIPLVVLVIAGVVVGVVVLGRKKSSNQDAVVKQYDEMKKQSEAALAELAKIANATATMASSSAPTDTSTGATSTTYEEELTALDSTLTTLEQDVSEAATAVEQAAGDVSETSEEYQQLYDEILAYYQYVEQLLKQAETQVAYLQSVAPTLADMQAYQDLLTKIQAAPPRAQQELSGQLSARVEGARSRLQNLSVPESLNQYNQQLQGFTDQLNGLSQQMTQAIGAGNTAAFSQLSSQFTSVLNQTQQQLSQSLNSVVSGLTSGLSQAAGGVHIPQGK